MKHKSPQPDARIPLPRYWQQSQLPLQSLVFLMPLLLIYELGMAYYAQTSTSGVTQYIYARSLLQDFFELFGITGYYLPGLLVAVVLLTMHVLKRDPWRISGETCIWMGAETLLLAFALFICAAVLFRSPVAWAMLANNAGTSTRTPWPQLLVRSFGAGIYEELMFRLIAIAMVHMLLVDALKMPEKWGAACSIIISAVLFALYHFSARNPFNWYKCFFYVGAGLYFACIYVLRGFGVVAGTHALYDVLVVLLRLT